MDAVKVGLECSAFTKQAWWQHRSALTLLAAAASFNRRKIG